MQTGPKARTTVLKVLARFLLSAVVFGMIAWSVLAIYYSNLPAQWRPTLAAIFVAAGLAALFLIRPRHRGLLVFGILFVLLIAWWSAIPPSNDRVWDADVAVLPFAEISGNRIVLHNIRNCDYRTETDFDVHYYDKSFNLDQLSTLDLFTVYWGSPLICHTMLSFGFGNEGNVCISIETRKEKGEAYSSVKGFFRQYELTYVVADERDLIRLRTNYRGEQVYLYRLNAPPDRARNVFLDYLKEINSLKDKPEWYNTLTSNCTSNIRGHTKPYAPHSPWSWKLVVNGYVDELAYANGALLQSLPFAELKKLSFVNERGKLADKDPEFSKRIREGLPGF